jgi:hypothetical protein
MQILLNSGSTNFPFIVPHATLNSWVHKGSSSQNLPPQTKLDMAAYKSFTTAGGNMQLFSRQQTYRCCGGFVLHQFAQR